MKITMKLEGDKEVQDAIKFLEKKCSEGLKKAITESVIHVESVAKHTTAWKNVSGNLRSKITHKVKSAKNKHQGKVGTNVEYAPWLEFGTVKMKAHPWLIPALKQSRNMILSFLHKALGAIK